MGATLLHSRWVEGKTMNAPILSFPTQPSPSLPNPTVKPCSQCHVWATASGLVTDSSLGGKRDEPTASGNNGPGIGLGFDPGRAGVPKIQTDPEIRDVS